MKAMLESSAWFATLLTIAAFGVGRSIRRKTGRDIANPLLISILVVIAVLLVFDLDVEAYQAGAQHLTWLLTPSTVCLALPLYRQIDLLRKNPAAIAAGIVVGVLSSAVLIVILALLFQLDAQQTATLLPKSVTTAIGIGISEELGGVPALTVAVIILTGLCGNLAARPLCRLLKITDPAARGLAIGASSHALGTARALEMGEVEGAMSSVAVAACGLLTVVVAPAVMGLM